MLVNMHEAKSTLSKLGDLVLQGETVIITKAGKPLFKLVPYDDEKSVRKPGMLAGQIKYEANWDQSESEITDLFV